VRVPPTSEVRSLDLRDLIDRFNMPCGDPGCRNTTKQVNHDLCLAHQVYYQEIKRRESFVFENFG
jgi:hypothetical protein